MLHPIKTLTLALCLILAPVFPASAQEEPDPDQVMATVNGTDITLGHMIVLRSELPEQYNQLPSGLLFQGILDQLIQHTLLQQSVADDVARKSQIAIENETRAIIAGEVMNGLIAQTPSEDAVRALYDERFPSDLLETEYRAAHILVATEEEANALLTELEDGAEFAALAQEHSTGPSGTAGGDLGWFGPGDMVEDFFNAVLALNPGETSPPVQTNFGWHVIQLAETRERARPEFETVQDQLVDELRQTTVESHIAKLRANAEISRAATDGINPEVILNIELLEK